MDDTKDQARGRFAQLQRTMQPHITQLQERVQTVPDRLANLSDNRRSLPAFPAKAQDAGQTRSRSNSDDSAPPPAPPAPPAPLIRAPALHDPAYNHDLAALAAKILYRAGTDPVSGGPLLILCAAAFPDANEVDYTVLLPYVLSNLPADEELGGLEDGAQNGGYSVIFFAGGGVDGKPAPGRPSWKWTLQAYTLLGRAVRKKIRKLWVVHEKGWIRVILELMANVVSVKFKKKVVHLNTLTDLASHIDITKLKIPPAVYLYDRKIGNEIRLPGFPKPPIFGNPPFPNHSNNSRIGDSYPLPMVLVDTSNYIRRSCLEVEGLFRVPPSQALLEVARQCYDRHTSLQWEDWGPHTAAGLIKLFYRSLPEPMIPVDCYEQMQSLVAVDPDPERMLPEGELAEVRFEVVRALLTNEVTTLPAHSRILFLRHLLPLLAEVAAHGKTNKMTASNLAVCVAASLARSDDMIADAKASAGIRKFLEIGIERIEELAPKLPLRRGGAKRHSATSSVSSLKAVPRLITASRQWENERKQSPVATTIPEKLPSAELYEAFQAPPLQRAKEFYERRQSTPHGPRPPPPMTRAERALSHGGLRAFSWAGAGAQQYQAYTPPQTQTQYQAYNPTSPVVDNTVYQAYSPATEVPPRLLPAAKEMPPPPPPRPAAPANQTITVAPIRPPKPAPLAAVIPPPAEKTVYQAYSPATEVPPRLLPPAKEMLPPPLRPAVSPAPAAPVVPKKPAPLASTTAAPAAAELPPSLVPAKKAPIPVPAPDTAAKQALETAAKQSSTAPAIPPKPAPLASPSPSPSPSTKPPPAAPIRASTAPVSRPRTPSFAPFAPPPIPAVPTDTLPPPSLPPPRKLSVPALEQRDGGTFQRPTLRRVVSVAERSGDGAKPHVLRRARSSLQVGEGLGVKAEGEGVRGLRALFEERGRERLGIPERESQEGTLGGRRRGVSMGR